MRRSDAAQARCRGRVAILEIEHLGVGRDAARALDELVRNPLEVGDLRCCQDVGHDEEALAPVKLDVRRCDSDHGALSSQIAAQPTVAVKGRGRAFPPPLAPEFRTIR